MKLGLFAQILGTFAFTISLTASLSQLSHAQSNLSSKFLCGMSRGMPATLVRTSRGNIPIIRWVDAAFPKPWSPERRCEEISTRFQRYYDNGTLKYISTGKFRGQPVLCVASEKGGPCLPEGVLVTLKPGTNSQEILERLMDYRGRSSSGIIELSGKTMISFINGAAYLDVEKFIAEAESSRAGANCPPGRPAWKC